MVNTKMDIGRQMPSSSASDDKERCSFRFQSLDITFADLLASSKNIHTLDL